MSPLLATAADRTSDLPPAAPLEVAWQVAGCPQPDLPFTQASARCARCATAAGRTIASRKVVSGNFTDYDTWHHPAGPRLCGRCAWAYTEPANRTGHYLLTRQPQARTVLDPAILTAPLPATMAVIAGRPRNPKHVLPDAPWGHVTSPDRQMQWTSTTATLFCTLRSLRTLPGVTPAALAEPAIPIRVLRHAPPAQWSALIDRWESLAPWRTDRFWWPSAVALSSPVAAR